MKRLTGSIVAPVAVLALAAGLTACSSDGGGSSEEGGAITVWIMGDTGTAFEELAAGYTEKTGTDVNVEAIPWANLNDKITTSIASGSGPDVIQIGLSVLPTLADAEALLPLDDLLGDYPALAAENFADAVAGEATQIGGQTLSVPWVADTRVLFYRSDVLASVGYPHGPRTWDELLDAMTRIQRERKSRWGILMPTNEFEPILALALSNGSPLLNQAGTRGAFEEPPFREAFNFYIDIFHRGFAPVVSNTQVANLYQQFAQNEFAMHITGPWNVGEFKRRLPPEMDGKWATAPLPARDASSPTGISMAGGSSLVIFRASHHKEAARKLIEFLSEPAQQVRFFALTGDLPARRSAWATPALANDPYFPAFREQLERVAPMPKVPEWEEIANSVFEHGESAIRRAATPAEALADLDRMANDMLAKRRWILARAEAKR